LLDVAALVDKAAIAVGTQGTIVRVKGTDAKKWRVEASGVKETLNAVATLKGQPAWIGECSATPCSEPSLLGTYSACSLV
jgi:hypothetical protein